MAPAPVGAAAAVAVASAPAEVVAPAAAAEPPAEVAAVVVAHPAEVPAVVANVADPQGHRTADPVGPYVHHPRASGCHVAASTQRPQ